MVVADILAAGLLRVTGEIRLLIAPHAFGSQHQDSDAEDEEDRQPYLAKAGRVLVHATQLGIQRPPAHVG